MLFIVGHVVSVDGGGSHTAGVHVNVGVDPFWARHPPFRHSQASCGAECDNGDKCNYCSLMTCLFMLAMQLGFGNVSE